MLDGVSMLTTWRDPEAAPKRVAMYWHYPLEKPHFLGGRSGGAIRSGSWKLIEFFDTNKVELFHLDSDPSEKTNLAAQRPNKRHELHTQLIRWRKSVGATKAAPKR
jgi:arylsulfatase A-like enzyme